ncbi:hypothetical protein [Desulfovibrio sp. JC022]|uniref:hypothetical protein n=1 Tax=Desulfovibrio sp. JC022 TaxID=2593642 RepID=UPI0013D57D69|nr:hypothetical protein [Desulfovibrio sp. JC022]NDV24143.1 hypothetical protein [Desulfovibrio sp. JC022]
MKGMKIVSTLIACISLFAVLLVIPVQASEMDTLIEQECRKSLASEGLGDEYLAVCVAGVKSKLMGNQPPRVGINMTCPPGTFPYSIQGDPKVRCAKISYANSNSCPAGQQQIVIQLGDKQVPMCVRIVSQ